MQTHAKIPRQSLVLVVLFLFLAGISVTQAASSIHWCLAQPRPLSTPVLTFVSDIKNVPAQKISGRHIYLSCRIYCCGWWSQINVLRYSSPWYFPVHNFVNILFSQNHCVVIIFLADLENASFTLRKGVALSQKKNIKSTEQSKTRWELLRRFLVESFWIWE